MNLKYFRAGLGLALTLGAIQGYARTPLQDPTNPSQPVQTSAHDSAFLAHVSQSNLAEIAAARIALDKDISPSVKGLAQMVLDDHMKAQDEVKKLAGVTNLAVPTEPDSRHQSEAAKLNQLSGAAFESRFIDDQKRDHADAILLFKKELRDGSHPAIRAFAEKTLPALKRHAEMVKQLKK